MNILPSDFLVHVNHIRICRQLCIQLLSIWTFNSLHSEKRINVKLFSLQHGSLKCSRSEFNLNSWIITYIAIKFPPTGASDVLCTNSLNIDCEGVIPIPPDIVIIDWYSCNGTCNQLYGPSTNNVIKSFHVILLRFLYSLYATAWSTWILCWYPLRHNHIIVHLPKICVL